MLNLTNKNQAKGKALQPWKVFLSLIFLNIILGLIVYFFPKEGIYVNDDLTLNFVSVDELLDQKEKVEVDLKMVLEGVETIQDDSTIQTIAPIDILNKVKKQKKPSPKRFSKWLSLPTDKPDIIINLLNKIKAESNKKVVRILHYGDSQLEGDRITNYLRNRFQKKFGGYGPGILLPLEPTASSRGNFRVDQSDDFIKHSIYSKSALKNTFGLGGASFTINTPTQIIAPVDSLGDSSSTIALVESKNLFDKSFFSVSKMYMGYSRSRKYSKAKLLFSNDTSFQVKIIDNDSSYMHTILKSPLFGVKEWSVGGGKNFQISFAPKNSPTIYGLALDGETGVAVDNFPMRGSSGLGFTKMGRNRYSAQLSMMNVVAVILQFGVNIIPDVRDNYDYYEKWFSRQLQSIQQAGPEIAIIVVGPSDMGKNKEGDIVSYENIPLIRDAMKNAALKNGCCFWDLYEAMGGENSMSAWVSDDLAQKDYTHFTYKGARFVGEMLYNSIMDYE